MNLRLTYKKNNSSAFKFLRPSFLWRRSKYLCLWILGGITALQGATPLPLQQMWCRTFLILPGRSLVHQRHWILLLPKLFSCRGKCSSSWKISEEWRQSHWCSGGGSIRGALAEASAETASATVLLMIASVAVVFGGHGCGCFCV